MRLVNWIRPMTAALAAVLLTARAWAAPASVQAVWVPRKIHFVYQAFTSFYSCDALRDEIESLLTKLGARDLTVRADPCLRPGGVDPYPGVQVTMRVLVPAGASAPAAAHVAAHWRKVVLTSGAEDFNAGGKCELVEQFRRAFLPLFQARHVDLRATCVPHEVMMDTYLSAEVLAPDSPPAPPH